MHDQRIPLTSPYPAGRTSTGALPKGTQAPTGLYFTERKLWDECPEARDVLERLLRYRQALALVLENPAAQFGD